MHGSENGDINCVRSMRSGVGCRGSGSGGACRHSRRRRQRRSGGIAGSHAAGHCCSAPGAAPTGCPPGYAGLCQLSRHPQQSLSVPAISDAAYTWMLIMLSPCLQAMDGYPELPEPQAGSPAHQHMWSPGPKSHRIVVAVSPFAGSPAKASDPAAPAHTHGCSPTAARKLDMGGGAGVDDDTEVADGVKSGGTITAHRFLPEIRVLREGAAKSGVPGGKPSTPPASSAPGLQKHSYVPVAPVNAKDAGGGSARNVLANLAHRFVPGLGRHPSEPAQPDLAEHSFLPEAPAKVCKLRDLQLKCHGTAPSS